jgi:hypothetical protein
MLRLGKQRILGPSRHGGRNPLIDPRPGDIIRTGGRYGGTFIEVTDPFGARLNPTDVSFMADGREYFVSLNQWRKDWPKDVEIIRKMRQLLD